MANVTGVDDKTRKHCELRGGSNLFSIPFDISSRLDSGFLVISLDNQNFVTKYCTIVDGMFRVHKSRLSEQTDHELSLNRCTLSFPEERTRDIQFALIDEQVGTIFIRGNNIYSMGRLLNTLAKYVEITGSSQFAFPSVDSQVSTPLSKHRNESTASSQAHIYSDVDAASSPTTPAAQSNEIYFPSSLKSGSSSQSSNMKTSIYHNASKLYDDGGARERTFVLPARKSSPETTGVPKPIAAGETYDRPKSYDNIAVISTPVDKNNNHVLPAPSQRAEKVKTEVELA